MLQYIFVNNTRRSLDKDPTRAAIHQLVNEQEESRRDSFFVRHNSRVAAEIGFKALLLQNEFAKQNKELSDMSDKFNLAFTEPFTDGVSTVELGVTSSPEDIQQIDGLKSHYARLLDFLVKDGLTEGEIPREDSERIFGVEPVEEYPGRVIVSRTRQLLIGTKAVQTEHCKYDTQFAVTKRMVFTMPSEMYVTLAQDDPLVKGDDAMKRFERQIDSNHRQIDPIRTAYYLGIDTLAV